MWNGNIWWFKETVTSLCIWLYWWLDACIWGLHNNYFLIIGLTGKNTISKLLATVFFLYFACLLPDIAFGTLYEQFTEGKIGMYTIYEDFYLIFQSLFYSKQMNFLEKYVIMRFLRRMSIIFLINNCALYIRISKLKEIKIKIYFQLYRCLILYTFSNNRWTFVCNIQRAAPAHYANHSPLGTVC